MINAKGEISFLRGSPPYKRQLALLESEGVVFNDGRVSLKTRGWEQVSSARATVSGRMLSPARHHGPYALRGLIHLALRRIAIPMPTKPSATINRVNGSGTPAGGTAPTTALKVAGTTSLKLKTSAPRSVVTSG